MGGGELSELGTERCLFAEEQGNLPTGLTPISQGVRSRPSARSGLASESPVPPRTFQLGVKRRPADTWGMAGAEPSSPPNFPGATPSPDTDEDPPALVTLVWVRQRKD